MTPYKQCRDLQKGRHLIYSSGCRGYKVREHYENPPLIAGCIIAIYTYVHLSVAEISFGNSQLTLAQFFWPRFGQLPVAL